MAYLAACVDSFTVRLWMNSPTCIVIFISLWKLIQDQHTLSEWPEIYVCVYLGFIKKCMKAIWQINMLIQNSINVSPELFYSDMKNWVKNGFYYTLKKIILKYKLFANSIWPKRKFYCLSYNGFKHGLSSQECVLL